MARRPDIRSRGSDNDEIMRADDLKQLRANLSRLSLTAARQDGQAVVCAGPGLAAWVVMTQRTPPIRFHRWMDMGRFRD